MTDHRPDPFESLAERLEPASPNPEFSLRLRARLIDALGLEPTVVPTIDLPERSPTMSTTPTSSNATDTSDRQAIVPAAIPYLTVHDGPAALDWYVTTFGATEVMRVAGDDGRIGHAELSIDGATVYLSDEHPDLGVVSPRTLGGTSVALHLTVATVDEIYARAIEAGATALAEPADQPHGARHGTLVDPFGHRWLLSQPIEQVDVDTYRDRAGDHGFTVSTPRRPTYGQIWAAMPYADAPAGIRFLTEVLGFEAAIVVPNEHDPTVIEHSQLVWPEGGVLQAATADRPGNPYSARPVGSESLYVVTADPESVWERCRAAGVEVVDPPQHPEYAPDTMVFSIRDPEGNIFSFGSYAGEV
jgi:PhnB protein